MPVPASQMWTVATYVLKQKLKGRKRYPLVLMLEPLYRCNLACAGCGKIQYPGHVLKRELTPEECFRAVEECDVPTVAIPGGEPLMHPRIDEIVRGLVARKKYVYMCTNALLLKEKLHLFTPSKYLSFSVHMDGEKEHHDLSVCKEGGYEIALEAIREAVGRGFRVTTNTTIFEAPMASRCAPLFDQMMDAGVEGMMLSPGYSYDKAPDQQHFSTRESNQSMFRRILSNRSARWQFNMSPLFLEFLMGKRHLECTPWGMPACQYLRLAKALVTCCRMATRILSRELLDSTDWSKHGYESGNSKCANCMLHSGYEASAVDYTFSFKGIFATVRAMLSSSYRDTEAARQLDAEEPHSALVQIEAIAPRSVLTSAEVSNAGRTTRRHRTGLRLSRRRHRDPGQRRKGGRLHLRSRASHLHFAHHDQARTEGHHSVRRRLASCIYRPRYGRWPQLGSLDPQVRESQGRRRDEHRVAAGVAGLTQTHEGPGRAGWAANSGCPQ